MSHDRMLTDTPSDPREWAWATEHAAPEWASTVQLVSWLARGELPPHTLVWKPGWGEWLPALQVAELAAAFPGVTAGSRRVARGAFDAAGMPPPVPVAQYPRLRLLARDVIRDASAAPAAHLQRLALPAEQLVRYHDADHAQQDLVTKQVPAADMLQAAQAMQAQDAARPRAPARRYHERQRAGELGMPAATLPPRSLAPLAVELAPPAPRGGMPGPRSRRAGRGYGRWLSFGALSGAVLGVLSALGLLPPAVRTALPPMSLVPPAALTSQAQSLAAAEQRTSGLAPALVASGLVADPPSAPVELQKSRLPAPEVAARAPAAAVKPPRIRVTRSGEPASLLALRITKNDGFDRLVFEFRERVPGYRIEYVDRPARDCDSGQTRRLEGTGRLELRFFPAQAQADDGEPTFRARELKPALSVVREVERTCDRNGVLTWVVGTSAANRYRAYEMAAPPRLIVQIEH